MNDLRIVKGNTFETIIEVRAYTYKGQEIKDFDLQKCTNISVVVHINGDTQSINSYEIIDQKNLVITWAGKSTKVGAYSLEVRGKLDDLDWRFYDKQPIFTIVNTNAEANIPKQSIIKEGCYCVNKQDVYLYNATTENKIDYIGGDYYVYRYDPESKKYVRTNIYVKGVKGDSGIQGMRGEVGPAGPEGPQGPLGDPGTSDYNDLLNKPDLSKYLKGLCLVVNLTQDVIVQYDVDVNSQYDIIYKSDDNSHVITIPSNLYVTPTGNDMQIHTYANGYSEVNLLNVNGIVFACGA